ncbi:neuropeptide S receptor [Orycteropus afer afer]|uniref:Neuropeptide S receptor n=1 Tax=Orycteropus afer afer TaxID=1230840 RepID=A0A8B7B0L2_ORYAF|nr:neuropeptide S receptor [Orycteropus afer afer]
MPANLTEGSLNSSGTTQMLDPSPAACIKTVTSTEVVEDEEWGSFYHSFKTEQLITLWVLFVFTIVGNAIVLFSTWRRKRKSRMIFFVTQLAITDSFTGLVNILTDIIWRFTGDFMAPDLVCRVVRYFQVVLLYASTYVLVSLSIDRYHAIVYPMKFQQGEKQAKVLIVIAWSLSFLFSIPTLIIFGKRKLPNGEVQCWALWPDDSYWTPYMTIVAFLVYFIPLAIISVIYGIVIRTIWMKSKAHETVISNCSEQILFMKTMPLGGPKRSTHLILTRKCGKYRHVSGLSLSRVHDYGKMVDREQRSRDSRMTFRERTERHEMQVLSKPEFI